MRALAAGGYRRRWRLLQFLLLSCFILDPVVARERLEAPKITRAPRNRTIMAKTHAVFVCQASGNPGPQIHWFLNGQELEAAKSGYLIFKMPHGSVLRLPNAGMENHGARVTCQATNPIGNASAIASLKVYDDVEPVPKGFPAILQTGSTVIKQKGQDAELKCRANGTPPPNTEWYKDYLPINLSDPRYTVEREQLKIRSVMEDDEGVYECMVTNRYGTVSGQVMKVYVRVRRYPPHFLTGMKKKVSVLPGSAVNLTCIAAGSPMPEVKWRQGGHLLSTKKRHMGQYTLMLTDIRESGNFTCVAASKMGEVEHTTEVIVKELPKPPKQVYMTHAEARLAGLRWSQSESKDVESYTILVRRQDAERDVPPKQIPNIARPSRPSAAFVHYTVTGLEPNTRYEMRVMAISKIGQSNPSDPAYVKTNELPPGSAPRNVRAEAITTRTLRITWQPPKEKNGLITSYKVYFTQNPKLEMNKWQVLRVNGELSANINHLKSNATYHISVSALNSAGEGPVSDHFPVIVTPGVPSRPRNFQAITVSPNLIQLAWEPPEGSEDSQTNRVLEYLLKYSAAGSVRVFSRVLPGDKKAYLMQNLTPDTSYTILLTAKTNEGRGVPAKTTGKTKEYVPHAPPENVTVTVLGPFSARVSWEPPPVALLSGRIVAYSVLFGRAGGNASATARVRLPGDKRSYQLTNLAAWTKYEVRVTSSTPHGEGLASKPRSFRTAQSVPTSPEIHNVEVLGSTSVKVFWRPPREERGRIQYFTVEAFPTSASGASLGQKPVSRTAKPTASREALHSTVVDQLEPNAWYRLVVRAVTRRGRGDPATFRPVKTKGEVPSPPRNLVVSTKLATVAKREYPVLIGSWLPPVVPHGKILQYRLRFSIVAPTDMVDAAREVMSNVSSTTYESSSDKTYFGVTYKFSVAAMNSVDYGDETSVTVTTPDAIPGASPQSLIVTDRGPSEVELRWDPPVKLLRNGKILQFEVRQFQRDQRDNSEVKLNTSLTTLVINNLATKTTYAFMVRAWTSAGAGPWTNPIYHQTSLDPLPPPPSNIKMFRNFPNKFKVTWRFPVSSRGNYQFKGFRLFYSERDLPHDPSAWETVDLGPVFSHEVLGVKPTTSYVVRMSTISEKGQVGRWSEPVLPLRVRIPRVTELTVVDLTCTVESSSRIKLTWGPPARKTDLEVFKLDLRGKATYVDALGQTQQHEDLARRRVLQFSPVQKLFVRVEQSLKPNTNYALSLRSSYRRSASIAPDVTRIVNTSCQTLPEPPTTVQAPVPITRDLHPDVRVGLEVYRASERNGPISMYLLVVSPLNKVRRSPRLKMSNAQLAASSKLVRPGDERAYIATTATPSSLFGESRRRAKVMIGGKGRALTRGVDYVAFLRACVRTVDKEACTDSQWSSAFGSQRTPVGERSQKGRGRKMQTVLFSASAVVVIIFVIVCAAVWCFFRRRPKMPRDHRRDLAMEHSLKQPLMGAAPPPPYQPMPTDPVVVRRLNYQTPDLLSSHAMARSHVDLAIHAEPLDARQYHTLDFRRLGPRVPPLFPQRCTGAMLNHPPVPIGQFEAHVTSCKANDNMKFSQEYESIDPGQQFTWEHSNLDVNKPKNRYANVIAYDHSRVVLQCLEGFSGSDYINANYMDGYKKQNAYIATQGPLPETIGDFWRMIWEQRTSTIVMMTRLEERARVKCDPYWPQKGSESYDDIMMVSHLDTLDLAYYTIRTFAVQRLGSSEKREVRQFQFTAWPDHGVPDHPTPLLMFLRRVRAANPPDAGPVIVHCSAGVGRTGAYIVIDAMLERIKQEKTVDVYGHVTCLRAQRNYTVQTEDQYIFIHDALLEAIMCGNTEVPARNLAVHVQKLRQLEAAGRGQVTGMELEFRKIGLKPSASPFLSANLPPNRLKNRLVNVLPYEATRVCLQPVRGVEGSDYINASFIDGYLCRRAYIATQAPLSETTEDFWRMLWEHNSSIVVMLTKLREMGREKCHQYWPNARSARYQYFVVDPLSEYNMTNYILREFKVTDARDGQSRTIRQFHYTEWPEQGVPSSGESLIDFIGQVHKTKKQFGQDGPITVHCSAGVGRTGVFLTLAIVLDRMRYEGVVDMFQTVKMLRTQRPAMVQTEDQYQFCYASAIEYLNSFDHYATDVR